MKAFRLPLNRSLVLVCIGLLQFTLVNRDDARAQETAHNCSLHGRVGAKFPDGHFVPARAAKVYILYASEYVDRGFRDKFFTHRRTVDTAGGLFDYRYYELVDHDEELKAKRKNAPSEKGAMEIAARMLQHEDEAIAAVAEWISKHPTDSWQLTVITPDESGAWAANDLRPGSYGIVVRGMVSRMDADWQFSYDLEPGKTYSLEAPPHFFYPKEQ